MVFSKKKRSTAEAGLPSSSPRPEKRKASAAASQAIQQMISEETALATSDAQLSPGETRPLVESDARPRDLRNLCHILGISEAEVSLLPAARDQARSMDEVPYGARMAMVRLVANVTRAAAVAISSSLAPQLMQSVGARLAPSSPPVEQGPIKQIAANYVMRLPKFSREQRTALALLCSSEKSLEVSRLLDACWSQTTSASAQSRYTLTKKGLARAKDDAVLLARGQVLDDREITRSRYDVDGVRAAVDYVLLRSHAKRLPGRAIKVVAGGKELAFPGLLFRLSVAELWSRFQEAHPDANIREHSFRRIVDVIPHAVDGQDLLHPYAVDEHGRRTVALLQLAVEREVKAEDKQEQLLTMLERSFSFLMSEFEANVDATGECAVHSLCHALQVVRHEKGGRESPRTCARCMAVFEAICAVDAALQSSEAHRVAHESLFHVGLLLAHKVRVAQQEQAMLGIRENLQPHQAYVIVDYRRKVTCTRHDGNLTHWLDESKISLHSAAVFVGGHTGVQAYFDHVLQGSSKQDEFDTICVLEALLDQIKRTFPRVTEVVLRNDRAPCYRSASTWIALQTMPTASGIRVSRLLLVEASGRTTEIGEHFAAISCSLTRYVKSGYDITEPSHVVYALAADQRLQRTSVALIQVDRTKVQSFNHAVQSARPLLHAKYECELFAHASDIRFHGTNGISVLEVCDASCDCAARASTPSSVPPDDACYLSSTGPLGHDHGSSGLHIDASTCEHAIASFSDTHLQFIHQDLCDALAEDEEREAFMTPCALNDHCPPEASGADVAKQNRCWQSSIPSQRTLPFTQSDIVEFRQLQPCALHEHVLARTGNAGGRDSSGSVTGASGPAAETVVCSACGRSFSNAYRRSQHKCKPQQTAVSKSLDLSAFALQYAATRLAEADNASSPALRVQPGQAPSSALNLPFRFLPGWARRSSWAIGRGVSTVCEFKDEVQEVASRAPNASAPSLDVDLVSETLRDRYPERLRLPSRAEIHGVLRTSSEQIGSSAGILSQCIRCTTVRSGEVEWVHTGVVVDSIRRALLYLDDCESEDVVTYVTRDLSALGYGKLSRKILSEYIHTEQARKLSASCSQ